MAATGSLLVDDFPIAEDNDLSLTGDALVEVGLLLLAGEAVTDVGLFLTGDALTDVGLLLTDDALTGLSSDGSKDDFSFSIDAAVDEVGDADDFPR